MLFRIVSHPKNNKLHIDKFIAIDGVPENLLFDHKSGHKILKGFLGIDIPENIPRDIQREFYKDETVTRYIAPFEKGAEAVFDELPLYAIVIDYSTRQGCDLWDRIERMIDDQTPRDRKVPEPVVVAKDHRTGFSISVEDVPVVTLNAPSVVVETQIKKRAGRPRKETVEV